MTYNDFLQLINLITYNTEVILNSQLRSASGCQWHLGILSRRRAAKYGPWTARMPTSGHQGAFILAPSTTYAQGLSQLNHVEYPWGFSWGFWMKLWGKTERWNDETRSVLHQYFQGSESIDIPVFCKARPFPWGKKSTERFFFASKTIKTIVELEELKSIGNPLKTH